MTSSSPTTDAVRDFITVSFGASNATAAEPVPVHLIGEVSPARQRRREDPAGPLHRGQGNMAQHAPLCDTAKRNGCTKRGTAVKQTSSDLPCS